MSSAYGLGIFLLWLITVSKPSDCIALSLEKSVKTETETNVVSVARHEVNRDFSIGEQNLSLTKGVDQELEVRSKEYSFATVNRTSISGDTQNPNSEYNSKWKRSSSDAQCFSKIEGNDVRIVGSFKTSSVSLYFKGSKHFQNMEVTLYLKGYMRFSQVDTVKEKFSVLDLGITDDLDHWHKLHVGVYTEGSKYLGGKWSILVLNDGDSALSSKVACFRRPTDEIVGLEIKAYGQSLWSCSKPRGFTDHLPRTPHSRALQDDDVSHPSVVAFAVGLLTLLVLLTTVVFLLRFLLKKKKKCSEERRILRLKKREAEISAGISNPRPVSCHSTENSIYGVVISREEDR